uniref:Glycosyltransferase 2-like domain-containing protein n=1 Tax=viral metagenome TaxID=1070528 RepID=A0A6C0LSG6_9ZZZZ
MDSLVNNKVLDTLYGIIRSPEQRLFERAPKIHLFITHYNTIQYLQKCLNSVFEQTCTIPFQATLVDDASPDPYTTEFLDEWQKKEPTRLVIVRNKQRVGKGANLFRCLDAAGCDPEDIVCVLDGDDWLASPYSLQTVIERYQNTNCWVAYGSYLQSSGHTGCCTVPLSEAHFTSEKAGRGFRECSWIFSHLFTAKAFLWNKLPKDLNIFNGKQTMFTADQVFNIPLAEMAGSNRLECINQVLMIYNNENPMNDCKIDYNEQTSVDIQNRQRPAFKALKSKKPYDISIVIPCKGRRPLLETTIKVLKHEIANTNLRVAITLVEHTDSIEFKEYAFTEGLGWIHIPMTGGSGSPLGQFNRGLCFDIGHLYGPPCKYYMMHDSDLLVPDNFFNKVNVYFNRGTIALQPYSDRFVWQTNQEFSEKLQTDLSIFYAGVDEQSVCTRSVPGAKGGSFILKSDLFTNVGGYDPQVFWGYAPEDQLFWLKVESITSVDYADTPRIPMLHLWHPNAATKNPLLAEMDMLNMYIKQQYSSELKPYIQAKSMQYTRAFENIQTSAFKS